MNRYRVAPSLLSCDFAKAGEQIETLRLAGCETLHLDVMDGLFVPNISFGQPFVRSIRKSTELELDTHLMITDPIRYVGQFADAGSDIITVHIESCPDIAPALRAIREKGKKAGLSIKPKTDPRDIIPYLGLCDLILVMTVEPGFGGQKLIPQSLENIRVVREITDASPYDISVEADGGITAQNAREVVQAGANMIVAGSSVLGAPDIARAFNELTELIRK